MTFSAGSFCVPDFRLIFAPLKGYDEPEILLNPLSPNCLIGADAGQPAVLLSLAVGIAWDRSQDNVVRGDLSGHLDRRDERPLCPPSVSSPNIYIRKRSESPVSRAASQRVTPMVNGSSGL